MIKRLVSLTVLLMAGLSGCGTPAPRSSQNPTIASGTFVSVVPSASASGSMVPTGTPLSLQDAGYSIAELHMLDAKQGWAWASANAGGDRLLRTTDGGSTWADLSPRAFSYIRAGSDFLDGQTAWLSSLDPKTSSSTLIHTTNGGNSWTVLNQTPPEGANYHFEDQTDGWAETADVGAGNAYIRIYETTDSGKSWKMVVIQSPSPEASQTPGVIHLCNICGDALEFYPPSKVILTYGDLATDPGGAVRFSMTTNQGQTWQDRKLPLPSAQLSAGLVEPESPVFLDARNGVLPAVSMKQNADGTFDFRVLFVYATADGGLTWTLRPGLVQEVSAYRPQLSMVSSKDWFVPCGANLCVTHDAALTWQTITPNIDFGQEGTDRSLLQIAFADPSKGWAIIADKQSSHFYTTNDGGSTWSELPLKIVP